jgi:hypothetical protein
MVTPGDKALRRNEANRENQSQPFSLQENGPPSRIGSVPSCWHDEENRPWTAHGRMEELAEAASPPSSTAIDSCQQRRSD